MIQSICHLIASREHGSLEQHVADLSRWQARHTSAEIAVIAHPRYLTMLDDAVRFIPLNTDRNRHHPNLVWRLANHIRSGNFQIAHGHGSKSAQLLAAVQKYTDARQVITRHNVRHPRDKLASAFDARIAISNATIANSRLSWNIIPNGIDLHTGAAGSNCCSSRSPSILVVGRLVKSQKLEVILEAMTALPSVALTVLGDGPEQKNLESLCKQLGIESRVRFLGQTEYASALMRAADAMVITSRGEDTPYALVEALLCRCPVISTRSSYADEYIPPAYLLDQLDPASLAKKLHSALSEPQQLQADFSETFIRAANELTLQRMGTSTWEVYAQLIT